MLLVGEAWAELGLPRSRLCFPSAEKEEGISSHPLGSALKRQHLGGSHTASNSVAINGESCLKYDHFYIHKEKNSVAFAPIIQTALKCCCI